MGDHQVRKAVRAHGRRPRSVLVVGCNTGAECKAFLDAGAEFVHGVDVIAEVGADYRDPRLTYTQARAEDLPLESESFDLVFCFATLEHVHGIEDAFREMSRVLEPGGTLYTLAAPLWFSPYGHHKNDLFPDPWIHLRLTRDEIVALGYQRGLVLRDGSTIERHVDYMLNPAYFNMRHARDYVAACDALGLNVTVHRLTMEHERLLDGIELDEPKDELLASAHRFIARKPG